MSEVIFLDVHADDVVVDLLVFREADGPVYQFKQQLIDDNLIQQL